MRANKAITTAKQRAVKWKKAKFFCHLFTKIIGIGSSARFSVFIISIMNRAVQPHFFCWIIMKIHTNICQTNSRKKRQNQTNSFRFDEFHRIKFFFVASCFCCERFVWRQTEMWYWMTIWRRKCDNATPTAASQSHNSSFNNKQYRFDSAAEREEAEKNT